MKNKIAEIDKHLRTLIRVIIWKLWKIPTKRKNALIKIGIEEQLAYGIVNTRKGY